jgi:hypothetical protein
MASFRNGVDRLMSPSPDSLAGHALSTAAAPSEVDRPRWPLVGVARSWGRRGRWPGAAIRLRISSEDERKRQVVRVEGVVEIRKGDRQHLDFAQKVAKAGCR